LLAVENEESQETIWRQILNQGLSVREVEKKVKEATAQDGQAAEPDNQSAPSPSSQPKSAHIRDLEERLQHQLGTKVNIRTQKRGGTIEVRFFSDDELNRLLDLFDEL